MNKVIHAHLYVTESVCSVTSDLSARQIGEQIQPAIKENVTEYPPTIPTSICTINMQEDYK